MPIIESAIKSMKQSRARKARRVPYISLMKTMERKVRDAVKDGKLADAVKMLPAAYKAVDMAMKRNIIHRNTAARKKSHMAKLVATKK